MSGRRPASPSSSPPIPTSLVGQAHVPLQPSGLRASHSMVSSPDEIEYEDDNPADQRSSAHPSPNSRPTHIEFEAEDESVGGRLHGGLGELSSRALTETSALLRKPFEFIKPHAHEGPCNHGTFSPQLQSRPQSVRSGYNGFGFGGSPSRAGRSDSGEERVFLGVENASVASGPNGKPKKKMSTTSYLAELHGIKNTTTMYVTVGWICFQKDIHSNILQVHSILHSFRRLDKAIQMGSFTRRLGSGPHDGFILSSHGSIIRLKSRPRTTDQRTVLFRLQSLDIRRSWELPTNGRWPGSCRKSFGGKCRSIKC